MVLVQTVMRTQEYSGSMGLGVQLRDAKQNVKPLIASDGGTFRVCNLRWASVTRIRITDQDIRNVRLEQVIQRQRRHQAFQCGRQRPRRQVPCRGGKDRAEAARLREELAQLENQPQPTASVPTP